ncbi:helix-turn-helix domain-containing protein [Labrys sedimenti]|uniref:helix-turn-helix domain-containing protein n=1 Tax=Labrys sedimenti TaxID=3106036 RepID=UPI002ACA6374|nr:helix-turn-helix domain-containing protein [Labrys sp. ZIDIC5]MDZ5451238.1 helix-turn-helix domain-containing protein [Labrys sp. ZIDIC5]
MFSSNQMPARSNAVRPNALPPIATDIAPVGSSCFTPLPSLLGTVHSYDKGEEIYGDDEPADYVYEVISGAVRTCKLLDDGRRQIGAFHLPGDIFGLETDSTHRMTADAVTDTMLRLVRRKSLEATALKDIGVANALRTLALRDLRHAEDHMILLGRKTALERVVTFLLEMDRRLAVAGMFELPMCRRDIGDYLGLTLETVSRVISQLHGRGILGLSNARRIVLRNRQLLGAMTV